MLCPLNRQSDAPAVIDGRVMYSYQKCDALCCGIAAKLQAQGIKKGSVVAFAAESTLETILTIFALLRLGAICCPLSTREPSINKAVKQLAAEHVITPKLFGEATGFNKLDLRSIATYIFTSGSTGNPKIAIHTLSNHIYSALGVNSYFNLQPENSWQLSLPLWHVGGLAILFRCFLAGARVVLSGLATHTSWVPTQLLRHLDQKLPFKAILLGGAPLCQQLLLKASHLPIYPSYGLTEMSSTVLIKNYVLPYRRIKIENSELYVSGPALFQGYLGEKPQSGWFATGDLVSTDRVITGRKDRLFISGGENIQPEEIENALLALPGIKQAYVVPVDDPEFGKRPVAFLDNPYASLTGLHSLLPKFKHPLRCFLLPPLHGKPPYSELAARAKLLMQG